MKSSLRLYILLLYIIIVKVVLAQPPANYYNNAKSKSKAELKTALYNIIKEHAQLDYIGSNVSFRTTDWHPADSDYPNGYYWDMYSNNKRTYWSSNVLNREHNLPKSWWSTAPETTVAYSDLHNLYPSDVTANAAKSNYPLGVVSGTPTYTNGVVKVGKSAIALYSGTVFEPANEYKGDFARDYMYVVTCYENYANSWRSTGTSSMLLSGSTYPVFNTYALNLLLEWSRNDPVSSKEINRNNAVYALQGNRNPFVDFPVLAEHIWGKYMDYLWEGDNTEPEMNSDYYLSYIAAEKKLFLKLKYPESTMYYVYSVSGVLLFNGNAVGADSKIDVSSLEKGLYIVKLYSGSSRKTAKFIVN